MGPINDFLTQDMDQGVNLKTSRTQLMELAKQIK
jgi:hypothetical protein